MYQIIKHLTQNCVFDIQGDGYNILLQMHLQYNEILTLKMTSIKRRNNVVEMTSIFLVDATLNLRHNG